VAGDESQRQMIQLVRAKLCTADKKALLGGDEFGLILQACPLGHAVRIADKIRKVLADKLGPSAPKAARACSLADRGRWPNSARCG
jgi:GGDEF domain-containing protein